MDGATGNLLKIVTLPIQVPLGAKVSVKLSAKANLQRPFGLPKPDFNNRVEIAQERISVAVHTGEEIHVRWVEPGGDQKRDLPPDPTAPHYYSSLAIFDPSPFSRRMTLLMSDDGVLVDTTEPFERRSWLDVFFPGGHEPLQIALEIGVAVPGLIILVAATVFDAPWAERLLPWFIGFFAVLGGFTLFYEWLSKRNR